MAISWLDWKLGARLLLKYPALTIIGGLSLAAAIAIGVVGIEVAGELLYKRLPFDAGGRVVRLETRDTAASRVEPRVLHDFAIWRRSLKTVAELGAARVSERNVLTGEGRVESLRVAEITASAFPLTRVLPLLGRPLQPADEMPDAEPVVVLGYDIWQRQFLQDPAIIGRVVTVGRIARTVVGVMPPRFGFPRNQQLWVPLPIQDAAPREGPAVQVFGRLADGASWQDAAAELNLVSARLAADQPATHSQLRTRVRAFAGRTPGEPLRLEDLAVHAIVLLLLGAVSANVATLIFARTAMRESGIVVRHALGASRARVVAQIVTEGLVLALAAAALALLVAQTTVRYAWDRASQIVGDDGLPFWVDLRLEPATVAYALLLALVAAVLIGLLPALKATGVSIQRGLQGITSTGGTMKFGGIWSFIVGAQVACTLLFVPAAVGIYTTSQRQNESTWAPFPTERYLTFGLRMDNEALAGEQGVPDDGQIAARRARAYEDFAGRLREEPGVTHVTHGDRLPTMFPDWVALEIDQDGAPPARLHGNFEGGFAMAAVGAGYHEAFGARILAGRALQAADAGAPNGPSWSTRRSYAWSAIPSAPAFVRSSEPASASWDPGARSSAWSAICGRSPPIGVRRRISIAQPRRRSSILSWWRCASRGMQRRLRPASPPSRGREMRGCSSGTSSPSRRSSLNGRNRRSSAASLSAALCSRRWSSRRPVCTRSWPSPWRVAPARLGSVWHSAPPAGTCSVAFSPAPVVSSAAASSLATASSFSSRGAPTA